MRILTTSRGRKFSNDDLFLRVGQLDAPAQPEAILWFRKPIPWTRFGPQLLVIFGLGLPAFLFVSLRPNLGELSRLQQLLPWALATAALNAANEEFQFRCVPLAHLRNVLPVREALWLTAIFFGSAHYFGQPSGPIVIIMATIAGWMWAKSMVETRGAGWAFGIHLVQDVVIFYFLALSMKNLRTNGLPLRSSPMVVGGPCPGRTVTSSPSGNSFALIPGNNCGPSPPGRSQPPTPPAKRTSPPIKSFSGREKKQRLPGQ